MEYPENGEIYIWTSRKSNERKDTRVHLNEGKYLNYPRETPEAAWRVTSTRRYCWHLGSYKSGFMQNAADKNALP